MLRPSDALSIGKRVASEFSRKNVTLMAAGIAYNAFVSLAPLLILLLLLVSVAGGGLEDRLTAGAESSLPGPIADVVTQIFSTETTATGVSIVGLVVLLWGTLKIFRALDTAFSEIYETERTNTFVDQLVDGLVVLVALVVAVVATVAVSAVFATFAADVPYLGFLTPAVLVAGLVAAFFPMYYRFPDADLGWRDAIPGALFAALGWAALQAVFQVYLVFSGGGSENFFGGVIVVVTWLYFSGLVLLLGAVLNAVVGGHATGSPGGVGRGAAADDRDEVTRMSLAEDELARYLRDLRGRLTGYHEELHPATEPTEPVHRPVEDVVVSERVGTLRTFRPTTDADEEVEVIEQSRTDGDEREWTVTIRWRTTEPDSEA